MPIMYIYYLIMIIHFRSCDADTMVYKWVQIWQVHYIVSIVIYKINDDVHSKLTIQQKKVHDWYIIGNK